MKKIYILTAVFALLTLSLNAQVGAEKMESKAPKKTESIRAQKSTYQPKGQVPTMSQLLQGIEGMSSVLQAGSHTDGVASSNGSWRAPLKVNADEYTVGPFTGDNISSTALGFGSQYYDPQWVTITTELARSEFENHIGDEIVGFRFALGGNTSRVHEVSNFTVIPRTASGLDDNNAYNWKLADLTPGSTIDTYDDIVITTLNGYVGFKSIIVYSGSTVVDQWIGTSNETTTPEGWTWTGGSHFASNGDGSYYMTYGSSSGGGVLTISASLLNGHCSGDITVVINAAIDAGSSSEENLQIDVNGDIKALTNENPSFQDFTWTISPSGTSTAEYVELNGSYGGTWHEFYLDEPIVFNPASDVEKLRMGYTVHQYPSSDTEHYLNPVAFNDQSTGHDHYAHMYAAQTTSGGNQTKTVANGSTTSNNVPVRAGYQDYGWRTQMIYTGDMLGIDAGSQITSLTFYPGTNGINFSGSTVQLKLGHTSSNNFGTSSNISTSQLTPSDLTLVATVSPTTDASATEWVFTFDQPFTYNGGNLLVDLYCEGYNYDGISGSYSFSTSFYGESQTAYQSLYVVGTGSATPPTSKTGSNTQFLPKATFGYTGTSTTYVQQWWNVTNSFSSRGDLAVQLIFKSNLPKTDPPTLSDLVDNGDGTYTITATATDPTATVTLTIGNQTVEGTGSASITITQTETAQNVTATATAQETDKRVSDPATRDYTIPAIPKTDPPTFSVTTGETAYTITATAADPTAEVVMTVDGVEYRGTGSVSVTIDRGTTDQSIPVSATAQESGKLVSDPNAQYVNVPMLPITATPTITYTQTNGTVVVTANGEGVITLTTSDGQTVTGEGPISITIVRSLEDQTITATATAVATNHQPSAEATEQVPVPALSGTPIEPEEGLLRMHLLIVDQFKEDIPYNNSHPDRYGYVLKWEQPANADDHKQSSTVEVEIKKTQAQVNGYYTLTQVENDIDHDNSELTMDVLTADVGMYLPGEDPDVLYYEMQAKKDNNPALGQDYVTQLQYMKNVQKYEEMLSTSPNKTHQYPAEETYHYFDESTPIVTGDYGLNFMTYAPSVSTWGIQRRYFEEDGLNNTYGAPIWKTGVGQVRMISTEAQLQRGPQGSTQWDGVGGPCSLVFLGVEAFGDLPVTGPENSNIIYEPYMFRIWIESPGNNLRGCNLIAADPEREEKPGEHWEGDGTCYGAEPVLIWEEYTTDGHLYKDVQDPPQDNQPWGSRLQFGALDSGINDLIVYVRFYYRSTGQGINDENSKHLLRVNRDGDEEETPEVPEYYATEDDDNPDITTGIVEMWNDFNYGEVVSTTYVNAQGMQSDQPFDGVNIVVTRYSNGTVRTTKVVR